MCSLNFINAKFPVALLCVTLLVAGCSGSSSSDPQSATGDNTVAVSDLNDNQSLDQNNDGNNNPSNSDTVIENETNSNASNTNGTDTQTDNTTDSGFTSVSFDITVPAYSSNALQVSVVSNNKNLIAAWVIDELWAVSDEFASNTEHPLIITFSDNNGAIVLGQYETQFSTGPND